MCKNFTLCLIMNLAANNSQTACPKIGGIDETNPPLNFNVIQIGNANTIGEGGKIAYSPESSEIEYVRRENELLREMIEYLKTR